MGLFLFRFWPVIIPLLLYYVWLKSAASRARKAGEEPPRFRDGPLYWLAFSMLGVGCACFFWLGATFDNKTGEYVPPQMKDGVMIPGHIKERE